MSEMFDIYANSPFLLKFGVLFLIRNDVLDAGRVLELLTKKLFSDDPEHLATIIEIIDELQLGYSLEGKMAELARARKSLPSDLTLDGQKMTLLHKKTREFLFQN